MTNLDALNKDLVVKTRARHYVIGMATAKLELLQQEIDMAMDPEIRDERLALALEGRIDYLSDELQNLYHSDGNWVTVIKSLDDAFKFVSEPDCLANIATRAAAMTICDHQLDEYNEIVFGTDVDPEDVEYYNRMIREQGMIRMALQHYQNWMSRAE